MQPVLHDIGILGAPGADTHEDAASDLDQPRTLAPSVGAGPQVYVETYGCQMNVSDSEIVASLLRDAGYGLTDREDDADVILINTCAIREKAEDRVRGRLARFRHRKRPPSPASPSACSAAWPSGCAKSCSKKKPS